MSLNTQQKRLIRIKEADRG